MKFETKVQDSKELKIFIKIHTDHWVEWTDKRFDVTKHLCHSNMTDYNQTRCY